MGSFKGFWCVVIFTKTPAVHKIVGWLLCTTHAMQSKCLHDGLFVVVHLLGFNLWFWSRGPRTLPICSAKQLKSLGEFVCNGKTRLQRSQKLTRVISYDANLLTISDSLVCNMLNKVQYTSTSFNTFCCLMKAPYFAFVHLSLFIHPFLNIRSIQIV